MTRFHSTALISISLGLLAAAAWLATGIDAPPDRTDAMAARASAVGVSESSVSAAQRQLLTCAAGEVAPEMAPAPECLPGQAPAADAEHVRFTHELRGVPIATLFARLQDLLAVDATATSAAELDVARRRFVWLIRHDPRALLELGGLLAQATAPELIDGVLRAVGAASTPAAEEFLTALLAGPAPTATRVGAVEALSQSTIPSGAAVQALRTMLADGSAPAELQGSGLRLLGVLARHVDGSDDSALRDLLAWQSFARDRGLVADWLEALANTGRPEVVDTALQHVNATDARERAAAISAIRQVAQAHVSPSRSGPLANEARVRAALADRAIHDESATVRAHAVESLAGRRDPTTLPLLQRTLVHDQDEIVRTSAMLALAFGAQRAALEHLLSRVVREDASPRMRELATDLLARRQR